MLSSRPDLLPDLYIEELEQLVDDVTPFPFDEARRLIDEEIGLEIFARLDERPLACASIAQMQGTGTLKIGIQPTGLDELEHVARSVANRLGAAMIISALLVASALMARVNDTIAVTGFVLSVGLGLFELWRILRTPGDL